jgi:hypothetical protein
MKIKTLLLLAAMTAGGHSYAQGNGDTQEQNVTKGNCFNMEFKHLDLSLTAGTTGLGFDLAVPLNDMLQVRTGFSAMPRFDYKMHFEIEAYDNNGRINSSGFSQMAQKLEGLTGFQVDQEVDMTGKPLYWNWNVMVDVRPFRNKHWHLTAGFFLGPKHIADAFNMTEEAPSLVGLTIYNRMYDRVKESPVLNDPDYFYEHSAAQIINDIALLKSLGINLKNIGTDLESVYFDPDKNPVKSLYENILSHGRMGIHLGDYVRDITDDEGNIIHKAGDPYMMTANEKDAMVRAYAYANRFKPYIGFGYGGRLIKGNDNYHVSFDCGIMMWGGVPKIITHDGTDLINDVEITEGQVKRYVDFISKFAVFPVVNVRFTRKLF